MANEKRLIDANAVKEKIWYGNSDPSGLRQYASGFIDNAPTVDAVEVVHGRWQDFADKYDKSAKRHDFRCSVCNKLASNFVGGTEDWWDMWKPNYCPNCGAKMDGGNEDG